MGELPSGDVPETPWRDPDELIHLDIGERASDGTTDLSGADTESPQWVIDIATFQLAHQQTIARFTEAVSNPTKENLEKAEEAIALLKKNSDLILGKDFYWKTDKEDKEQSTEPVRAAVIAIACSIKEMDAQLKALIPLKVSRDPYSEEDIDEIVQSLTKPIIDDEAYKKVTQLVRRHAFVCTELSETLKSPTVSRHKSGVKQVFTPQGRSQWQEKITQVGGAAGAVALGYFLGEVLARRRSR